MKFTDEDERKVWEKGNIIGDFNPDEYRKDDFGTWIIRHAYDDLKSEFGWVIVRIDPNGGDDINNLKPVQWRNIK